jgi:hypothetical protein
MKYNRFYNWNECDNGGTLLIKIKLDTKMVFTTTNFKYKNEAIVVSRQPIGFGKKHYHSLFIHR